MTISESKTFRAVQLVAARFRATHRGATARPTMATMNDSFVGRLLVATPMLLDPNFHRTVALICAQDGDGVMGVVLNRPLGASLADHLPAWASRASPPATLFGGGPVEPSAAIGLGRRRGEGDGEGWTAVTDSIGLLDLRRDPADFGDGLVRARVFSGSAGWTPGQLDAEIAEGAWFVVDARPDDPFSAEPERLWRDVLARQPGEMALFASFPPDPSMN